MAYVPNFRLQLPTVTGVTTVEGFISAYFDTEAEGQDYRCTKCNKEGGCRRKDNLVTLPAVLVVQIKRGMQHLGGRKNSEELRADRVPGTA